MTTIQKLIRFDDFRCFRCLHPVDFHRVATARQGNRALVDEICLECQDDLNRHTLGLLVEVVHIHLTALEIFSGENHTPIP